MEDDDDGEDKLQLQTNEDNENTASKIALLKDSISTTSGRSKRNNDTGERDERSKRGATGFYSNRSGSRNRREKASSSNSSTSRWANDIRDKYSSTEFLDITSLAESAGNDGDANLTNSRKISNLLANLPEDMRISKLLRQLSVEKDDDEARKICTKLNIVVSDPTNTNYIRRSFDILADTMMRIFKDGPIGSMNEIADVFGKMGWIIRSDFSVYRSWIQRMIKHERIRVYVLRALQQTLIMDRNTCEIRSDNCNRIIEMLKEHLEGTEKAAQFIAITNAIQQFAQNYPKQFQPHFADIVDIVIGWHLETDQVLSIKQHCSAILQTFKSFWLSDITFTRNLLSQFHEDIMSYRDDIINTAAEGAKDGKTDSPTPEICCGSIVGATNSILKCIYDSPAILCDSIGTNLIWDIVSSVLELIKAFEGSQMSKMQFSPDQCDIIYMYVNELIVIALECRKYDVNISDDAILEIITLQLESLNVWTASDEKISILLFVIYKLVGELRGNTPIPFIHLIFDNNSVIHQMKFSKNPRIVKSLTKIYQTVLNSKVVGLLQETYRYIVDDLSAAVNVLESVAPDMCAENSFYTKAQAEHLVNFYLSTISTLAVASSSIIVMWALEPNILDLLTDHMHCAEFDSVWSKIPETHYALTKLLVSHCNNNNNFVTSSSLLNEQLTKITDVFSRLGVDDNPTGFSEFVPGASSFNVPTTSTLNSNSESSPTSGHFECILKFLCRILGQKTLNAQTIHLLLDWYENIIKQSAAHSDTLISNAEFQQIFKSLNRLVNKDLIAKRIQLKYADCLDTILTYDNLQTETFQTIAETSCIRMCASDSTIRKRYSDIFAKLPLNISLKQVNQFTGLAKEQQRHVNSVQHWYLRTPVQQRGGEMRGQFFADFIRAIRIGESPRNGEQMEKSDRYHRIECILKNIFIHSQRCANGLSSKSKSNDISDFCKLATSDVRVLIAWAQWEAAQSCVNNKLRTAIGKPQETFLKIESIIKNFARILSMKENLIAPNADTILTNQRNARMLLGFMEALEKYIHNASEGTSFALPTAEKPARTFFHVNATTCNEWFSRIRTAADLIALHCMESEMVVRYTENVLRNLTANGKTNDPLFEHTLMSHAWALLRNKEGDALDGLFSWTKSVTKKKLMWIKMAAEQANGHLETAVAGYRTILESMDESKCDSHLREFIVDQMTICLANAREWPELLEVLRIEESRNVPRATIPLLSLKSKQIEDLLEYQESKHLAHFYNLSDWDILNTDSNGIANDFSYHRLISLTENTICNMSLDSKPHTTELEQICSDIVQSGLQECLRTTSREHLNNLVILNHICNKIAHRNLTGDLANTKSLCVDKSFGSTTLAVLLHWCEYFDNVTDIGEQINLDLRLDLCSMTRKEGNLMHCKRQLEGLFEKIDFAAQIGCPENERSLQHICDRLIENVDQLNGHLNIWNKNTVRSVCEMAKWLYSHPERKETAIQLASAYTSGICKGLKSSQIQTDETIINQRMARTFLTLAEWLQSENDQFLSASTAKPLGKLISSLDDVRLRNGSFDYESAGIGSILSPIDLAIGKMLSQSVQQCPELSKAYGAYGNWCYRWGRKIVELRTEKDEKAGLRSSDLASILDLVPNATPQDIELISNVLDQHKLSAAEDEELIVVGSDEASSTELIEMQLRQIEILNECPSQTLLKIIEIWRFANRNIYSFYEMAADAYFKYLHLATQSQNDSTLNITNASDDGKSNEDCSIVTATLRILRLIVKHALGLQEVLEEGLESTPTLPWKIIIPQLFSRLNHHEPYVRRRVSELLCRVARDSPHLIIFPTVVGAAQEVNVDINDLSAEVDIKTKSKNSALTVCFNSLLNTLANQASKQIEQVQMLVRELKRVTLLWEELWLSSLSQVYSEWVKRMSAFEIELSDFIESDGSDESKSDLITEKYRAIVRPILFVLKRLFEITSVKAETANELAFQERYTSIIEETILSLEQPRSFDQVSPAGWVKFKQLYAVLQQRAHKRSACMFKMNDISPVLAQMKNTVITMPGVESQNRKNRSDSDLDRWIYIRSADSIVQILPTKTKPKKLAFYGSDGNRYTYLFKGQEDLHLDERIMQFLSIANSMMAKTRTTVGQTSRYHAKHYSVTPLGAHSGLISWVEGMTPIFALYKKWQQRQAANPRKEKEKEGVKANNNGKNSPPPTILRPSELYFQKLTPLLNKLNIKTTQSSRKEWPLSVLKEVLIELKAETPCDLLAKELWCYSTNAAEWKQVTRNYAQSLAVMSVIGYVIGLGDRHLDNILVDLVSGEILHIDYNVCFEKGKTLRVPEKVPFRMTPNLQGALGVTGIEGTFRLACEHVLKTLKKGRETLLTLLEAFVYDPLVDWAVAEDTITGGAGHVVTDITSHRNRMAAEHNIGSAQRAADAVLGFDSIYARKQMKNELTREALVIQFTEIKPDWIQNRDGFFNQLKQLQAYLMNLQKQRTGLQSLEENRLMLSKQAALVAEADALGTALTSHPLNTLTQRFAVYKRTKIEYDSCKQSLLDQMSNSTKQMTDYQNCLRLIEANKTSEYLNKLNELMPSIKALPPNQAFDMVKDFLDNSAQMAIYLQCCQLSNALDALVSKQMSVIQTALETLIEYGHIARFHPPCAHSYHRITKYAEWCQYLSEHQSVQDCRDIVTQFQTTFGKNAINKVPIEQVITFSYQLQANVRDSEFKLQKLLERLNETDGDGTSTANIVQYTQRFEDARNSIRIFLQENITHTNDKRFNVFGLHCVTLTILCDLNKRLLMMENAAANAGDNMVDLTFNGNWVLDEMYAHSAIMCEMTSVIETAHREYSGQALAKEFRCAAQCLREIQNSHETIRQFNEHFSVSTLNAALHGVISEKESMMNIISALSNLEGSLQSIPELLTNLNLHLRRNALTSGRMVSPSPNDPSFEAASPQACADVALLRQKLDLLKMKLEQSDVSDSGAKLFLLLNGIFDKLDEDYDRLMECLQYLVPHDNWMKIDQVKSSIDLAALTFSPITRSILKDIFFVKRVEAMVDFFSLILQIACAFKGNAICSAYDDEQLCRPLRQYLTDFVWRKMFGLQSYCVSFILCNLMQMINVDIDNEINLLDVGAQSMISMDELCSKSVERFIKMEKISNMILNQATALCWNLDVVWRKLCLVQNLQNQISWHQSSMVRSRLILTAHFWMYEETFTSQPNAITTRNRAAIMIQLDEATRALAKLQSSVQRKNDELNVLIKAINQRLKWAVGANPNLSELNNEFVNTITMKQDLIEKIRSSSAFTLKECTTILKYEKLRILTPEALDEDQKFLNLVSRWEKSCTLSKSCLNMITPIEEALIELLDPEGPIDRIWLNSVAALIDEMVDQVQQDINKVEKEIVCSQDELQSCAYRLRSLVANHHRITPKLLALIRQVYCLVDANQKFVINKHIEKHGWMQETVTDLQSHILSKDFTEELVNVTLNQIAELLDSMKPIFNSLIDADGLFTSSEDVENKLNLLSTPSLVQIQHQEFVRPDSPSRTKAQKGMEQKRNAYAVSVWRRIRMKLEGRDPDPTRRYSTAEQVDWMIREAMDTNNLAVLYEGWTPWV